MAKRSCAKKRKNRIPTPQPPMAESEKNRLHSTNVQAFPLINHILERMNLRGILNKYVPADKREHISTARAILVLVRNVLVSRQPIYGIGEWASSCALDQLDLFSHELEKLNDDRLGRAMERLFEKGGPQLVMDLVREVVRAFDLSLEELHNDSTSISFYGSYDEAAEEGVRKGQPTPAITWGHSKDHRPDLKQLLFILTVTNDGGVPIYFSSTSGNVTDDTTHRQTWDLMRQLVGRTDFLYVADCKLATSENMKYIDNEKGRFISVLPATRKEDAQFRKRMRDPKETIHWQHLYDEFDSQDEVVNRYSVESGESVSAEGFRVLWYHSTRKEELDRHARLNRTQRAILALSQLQQRLKGPRTRLRQRSQVEEAVLKIREEFDVGDWLKITIGEEKEVSYRQASRGRPNSKTKYRQQTKVRYFVAWELNAAGTEQAQVTDGIFPLITNTLDLSAQEVLGAYKRQPIIEKRFSQLKTDFSVAPVYLKNVSRIQGLLTVYFFVLMVQTLLERELRRGMEREGIESIPLYPEGRPCRRPTARRVIDLFEPIQRHQLRAVDGTQTNFVTELSPIQKQILRLLKIKPNEAYTAD